MVKRIGICCLLVAAFIAYLHSPLAHAESVKAVLHTNEKTAQSSYLDNDGNGYKYTCGVLSTSKHQVTANYGYGTHEYTKGYVQPGKTTTWTITQKAYPYNKCKMILYGYSQAEPKKKCYAMGYLVKQ